MHYHALEKLHTELDRARALVNAAPERFESTPAGHLAEADFEALIRASTVVHRLMLWQKYPAQSPESYLPTVTAVDSAPADEHAAPAQADERS